MNFTFRRKRISGIFTVVPARERLFLEEMKNFNFPENRSLKLKEVMGYDRRRMVEPGVCVSDLAVFGLQQMFARGHLKPEEIDALLLVTQTPDYFMPPTCNIIQGRLELKKDMFCLDISQGCAGFVIGLMQAFMLLEQESVRKVVLINADVLSRKASPKDRNIYPLIGDAAAITVVERDTEDSVIHASVKMDGTRNEALMIPAGGLRLPSTPETAVLEDVGDNNLRAKDHLRMDGSAVFNFVQMEVPALIEEVLERRGRNQRFRGLFFVPSAEPVHARETGGQDEGAPCENAEQRGGTLRQQQRRHHSHRDHHEPGRDGEKWPVSGLPGRLWRGHDLERDADAAGRVDFLRDD